MYDRQPASGQAGRVLITPENTSVAPYYATIEMADNPLNPGTPLNKATLLQDSTAALYGLGTDAVPDQVLAAIAPLVSARAVLYTGSYVGTGTVGQANPNTITFPSPPKFVIVGNPNSISGYNFIWFTGIEVVSMANNGLEDLHTSVSGNTLSWYHENSQTDPVNQLNTLGTTYYYFALLADS